MNYNFTLTVISLICFISGAFLLSIAFGWETGLGIACLTWFHKAVERN